MPTSFPKIVSNFFCLLLVFCFTCSFAQSVNLNTFEKITTVKSAREFLEKKDFVVKQDSSTKESVKLKLLNRATREIIYVSVNKDSEGARFVEVEYFTASEEEYARIVHALIKYGYNQQNDNRHYEKRIGSYEAHHLVLKGAVTIKDNDYYGIKYSYYAGKELALPAAPANK
jgi:hypothetical protein